MAFSAWIHARVPWSHFLFAAIAFDVKCSSPFDWGVFGTLPRLISPRLWLVFCRSSNPGSARRTYPQNSVFK